MNTLMGQPDPTRESASMTPPATTDLSDDHPEAQVCDPVFSVFGGKARFCGPITTLKVFEDNTPLRRIRAVQSVAA